jgi:S-DNA-T family DNA segregation ATPase FtsK/SpoIIIE
MRSKLEYQADRIETVLSMHKVPVRVTGGTVTPRWVRFQVLPAMGTKISKIRSLNEELAAALDAPSCRVSRRGAAVAVEVPREDPQPVRLIPLLRELQADGDGDGIPAKTAVLGLGEDGAPLLIRLPSPDVAHILIAGTTGSGKTVLLRAILWSLAMTNPAVSVSSLGRDQGLAFVLIDPKGSAFRSFEGLPHMARPVVRQVAEAAEALRSLVRLMEKRSGDGVALEHAQRYLGPALGPSVVLVIDELADLLLVGGKEVQTALTRLTQRGREAGIHVIAATQKPTSAVLGPLVKANFPVRLVGRVTSVEDARTATGWGGTGAERLLGRGDFLAVAEGRVIRFQTAHVSPDEIRRAIADVGSGARKWSSDLSPALSHRRALPWPVERLATAFGGGA